jgi:cysteine desulfurase
MAEVYAIGIANSETGVLQPVPERGAAGAERILLDVTQGVGRVPFSFAWSGADLAVLSGHKLGGPRGVGALIVRDGVEIPPLALGGGQEMGRRSGTENVVGLAGFGAAIAAAMRDLEAGVWDEVEKLRNILETTLASAGGETIFVGKGLERLPNTSCFAVPGWKGETQVMQMDLRGFAVSAGSACSSGKVRESRVLRAMGYDETVARSAIRVSLGPETTDDGIARFAGAWIEAHERHRARAA